VKGNTVVDAERRAGTGKVKQDGGAHDEDVISLRFKCCESEIKSPDATASAMERGFVF
jgi:hypothetical protein